MKNRHTLFHILTGIMLALFIISAAVTLALNFRFIYHADIDRCGLTSVSGLTRDELIRDYDTLIDYNCIWGPGELNFRNFTLSDGARQHFREAKALFLFFGWGVIFFGAASLIMILASIRKKLGYAFLLSAAVITVILPAALGLFALTAWDRLFVLFHELSFGNELWLFDPAVDPVINVLPDGFFFHEAMAIFGLVITGGLICIAAHKHLMRRPGPSDL